MFGKRKTTTATGTTAAHPHTTHTDGTRYHISGPLAAIFALYFIFGLVELGLMIDIVHYFKSKFSAIVPDWVEARAGYATFAAAYTFIASILYFLLAKLWRKFKWTHVLGLTVLSFLFWIIAAPLLEKAFTHTPYRTCVVIFGRRKCQELKAARAFAWLLMVLSLLSIPVAYFFGKRAAHAHGTEPVTKEVPHTTGTTTTAATGHHATTGTTGAPTNGVHTAQPVQTV
ncbi:hypothetical protein P389DRAFT_208216 [Cystobasidium minutum MCA 4210]|uniref:uncharacterized protein n=1 Tax=Cystobasidium minutum MCA 4210 TaxID=1397322 RepID=UPI0034CDC3D9|eukprot:jgi/Rhomi1/208216/estExt_Genemark1.C_1_t30248